MIKAHLTTDQFDPPVVLVQTWCLLSKNEDEEVSQHAIKMLVNTFGDMRSVVKFIKDNGIRIG